MEESENKFVPLEDVSETTKEYINLKIDQYKLKGAEHLSVLSNKLIFLLIATMLGGVILQLTGLALAYFAGQLIGNTALGFLAVAVAFIFILWILYRKRDHLFTDKLVVLFIKIFFEKENSTK